MDFEDHHTFRQLLEAGDPRGDPDKPVVLRWERTFMSGLRLDTWHMHLASPYHSIHYGYVSKTIQDIWYLTVFPGGRDGELNFYNHYPSRDRAIDQAERWTRFNWRRLAEFKRGEVKGLR